MSQAQSKNMRLIAQHTLNGFGNMGEGMGLQLAKDGRRIMWLAHESPPKNFSGVDVSDIKNPKLIAQTELPHQNVRSNSLEVCGDLLVVAYQTTALGLEPAGVDIFDISDPENPKSIGFFDCSGPNSRGVHCVWFVDGEYIHCSGADGNLNAREPEKDYQIYQIIDVKDPTAPKEVGRWWMPGQLESDSEPPLVRHPEFDEGFRPHNTNVYPERPDRAYVGYIDGGMVTLDISDKANPKMITNWNHSPPFTGFTHTVLPLFSRDLLLVAAEATYAGAADWPRITFVVDNRVETNPVPISTLPMPSLEEFGGRSGRFGAHNLHENQPGPCFKSDTIIIGNYFNAGIRVHDLTDPFQPKEVAYYVPEAPEGSRVGEIQINDVYVDENQVVYGIDRFSGGLYILEMDV
ncbi:hypothetical protein N9452_04730 [Alphaproteobacteria bacterium]|nr:hypothetical protein [Alphaproteobacteria bacterium]